MQDATTTQLNPTNSPTNSTPSAATGNPVPLEDADRFLRELEPALRVMVATYAGGRSCDFEDRMALAREAAWNALGHFQPEHGLSLQRWAVFAARRAVLSEIRKYYDCHGRIKAPVFADIEDPAILEFRPSPSPTPAEEAERRDTSEYLALLMRRLTRTERRIVHLWAYDGWSQAEIARMMGLSRARVCRILSAALGRLRQALNHQPFA